PTPTPVPTPPPIPGIPRKPLATAKLFNGLALQAKLVSEKRPELASQDRRDINAYEVRITVSARLPSPSTTAKDFLKNDPLLPGTFSDFDQILAGSEVSPFFEKLYSLKLAQIEREIGRLDAILSRDNFYDCETILALRNPATGRRALLAVGDMDVNVDGSDGDRNVAVDGSAQFFLPQTSYRWLKLTERENPFVPVEQARLASLKSEMAAGAASVSRKKEIEDGIDIAKRRIFDLKKWSFLISETDPFIVLPGFMMRDKDNPFSPAIGDFALVLHGGKAYPAVLGDAGPSLKLGEASLLICRQLNARSSSLAGAVSDLKVAYLVFPGTAEDQHTPPDLEAWRAKCEQYAQELGGLKCQIHTWPNLVKPWPTPTPTPTPTPVPTPTPSPSPSATASPGEPVVVTSPAI
ncbi:MAG: glycoside hydrolase family 75 protein, partial [Verrucomicrobiota bacterium]